MVSLSSRWGSDWYMPRSIWNGTITFGMVNVPVKLYSATESKTVHFHEVHIKDGAKIEHRRIAAELRQQGMDLGAVVGLVIEEMRQDHLDRIR